MRAIRTALFSILITILANNSILAQTTEFTYQGDLQNASQPATGNFDFEFALFDGPMGGVQLGPVLTRSTVAVTGGTFSVILDFGNQYPGTERYLEVRVKPAGGAELTILSPRQRVTSAPYSVTSKTSDNSVKLGGVAASEYVMTGDARLSDARAPLPGSTNYIQNGTTVQAASDFNVAGTGRAGIFDAATQYNIGGARALIAGANSNTFVGLDAGANNPGQSNAFFGRRAGWFATSGSFNSFFGTDSGVNSSSGNQNAFFGYRAGSTSTSGSDNAFFGFTAGSSNGTGSQNTFVGSGAGTNSVNLNSNTLIGSKANTGGFGSPANATAIGANSVVAQSNALVLGSINGLNGATADTDVGIGTPNPAARLHVNNGSIRVTNGAVYITNPNTLIITSPNGACWGLTVSNAGAVSAFPINPCP